MKETMKNTSSFTRYNLRIPIEVKRKLRVDADQKNQSLNLYLNKILDLHIESLEKKESVILKRS